MIFDDPKMQALLLKYQDLPDNLVPYSIFLGRSSRTAEERLYLENLISKAPKSKRSDWISRILSEKYGQHLGAWFELMLYGWLIEIGKVEVEPKIKGGHPDFALSVEGKTVIIEARACIKDGANPHFFDPKGNIINSIPSEAKLIDWAKSFGSVAVAWMDSEVIKGNLREKANQHEGIKEGNNPYVVALLLESIFLSKQQIIDAWFGKEQLVLDENCDNIVGARFDKSGLCLEAPSKNCVSGILIFEPRRNNVGRCVFDVCYIQNPFAKIPLDPELFPADSRFVIQKKEDSCYHMCWQENNHPAKSN